MAKNYYDVGSFKPSLQDRKGQPTSDGTKPPETKVLQALLQLSGPRENERIDARSMIQDNDHDNKDTEYSTFPGVDYDENPGFESTFPSQFQPYVLQSSRHKEQQWESLPSMLYDRTAVASISTDNDHDRGLEDNAHRIFPGAVHMEGPRFESTTVPSQQRQQTEESVASVVYETASYRVDTDDDGRNGAIRDGSSKTSDSKTLSMRAVLGKQNGLWGMIALCLLLAVTVAVPLSLAFASSSDNSTTSNPLMSANSLTTSTGSPSMFPGSPPTSSGSPSMSTGSLSMSTGSPSMSTGSPTVSTGSPSMSISSPTVSTGSPSMSTSSPTLSTDSPTIAATQRPFEYFYSGLRMEIYDNGTEPFDHLDEFGFFDSGESFIDKITQVDVYVTDFVCVTDNDCDLPTASVLSLTATYALQDCTLQSRTQGAYTDGTYDQVVSIPFPPDVFLTRIEFSFNYVTICDSNFDCIEIGPYNATAPATVFEQDNSVIKAFYGSSGSWVDAVGVYYEPFGQSTSTCGF